MKLTKFSLFKLPNKYKRFDYTPRHYDPQKEDREKRLKQLEAERVIDPRGEKSISFRGGLKYDRNDLKTQSLFASVRVIFILGGLMMLAYYLFKHFYLVETPAAN